MRTLVVLAALAAAAVADNLVENGGFESGRTAWEFVSFSNQAQYEFDTKNKVEGNASLRLTKAGGSKIDTAFVNFRLPEEVLGGKLTVSAHVKGSKLGQGRLVCILYNGAGDVVVDEELHKKTLKKTFKWKRLETVVKVPDDAVSGRILMQVFRKGVMWLDGVSVDTGRGGPAREYVGGTNLLENGGFEDRRANWAFVSFSQQARYEFDDEDKREGKLALKVSKAGGAKIDTAFANFKVQPEQLEGRLRVSAQIKANRVGQARLVFLLYSSAGDIAVNEEIHAGDLKGSFPWTRVEKAYRVPEDVVSGRILLQVSEGGEVWLDDVQVVHQTEKKQETKGKGKGSGLALRNGDFDRSYSGWRPAASPQPTLSSRIDRKVTAGGKGALRLERKSPRRFPVEGLESSVRAKRGLKRATLVFAAKTEATTRGVATLIALDKRGALLAAARTEIEPGADFAPHRLALKIPRGTERLSVFLGVEGTGRVWFDDVKLEDK